MEGVRGSQESCRGRASALALLEAKLGWAAAGDVIRRTTDGGVTWTEETSCRAAHADSEEGDPYQFAEYVAGAIVIAGPCGRAILSRDELP